MWLLIESFSLDHAALLLALSSLVVLSPSSFLSRLLPSPRFLFLVCIPLPISPFSLSVPLFPLAVSRCECTRGTRGYSPQRSGLVFIFVSHEQ